MSDATGRWLITFNGELYNYRELRDQVAAQVPVTGRTDTEVLLGAIAAWGPDALPRFDGMFAFAAFDRGTGSLLLARDPFGEKPLYTMGLPGGGLAFASELQALERVPGFDGRVSFEAVAELLSFQYIGAPRSIYESVHKVPPGHWLRIDADGRRESGRYFEFRPGADGFDGRSEEELVDALEELLVTSTRRRLISDVPLGAFLSGGVDSSTVCALVRRKLGLPLATFSIGFEGAPESEHEAARDFAAHLGTDHHERIVAPQASEFLREIGALLDEPNADSSCLPTYVLSEFARSKVTVAVSGDGGDELFGGYGRYIETLDEAARSRTVEHRPGVAYYSNRILVSSEEHVAELLGGLPPAFEGHLAHLRSSIDDGCSPLFCRLRKTDVENYMPGAVLAKVDRMSMRHSLEVRTPFLNADVARFAEGLPQSRLIAGGQGKLLLRALAYRHLPRELINRPKQGFGLPMSKWGRDELLKVAANLLEADDSRLASALGRPALAKFLRRQRSRSGFSMYQLWGVAVLESWLRHHPATLPAWSERAPRAAARRALPALVGLGDRCYLLVQTHQTGAHVEKPVVTDALQARASGIAAACGLAMSARPVRGGTGEVIVLPSLPVDSNMVAGSQMLELAGAEIIAVEPNVARHWITPRRVRQWQLSGVRALAYPHPDGIPGRLVSMRMRQLDWKERWRQWLSMHRNTVASWSGINGHAVDGNAYQRAVGSLGARADTEVLCDFHLYCGNRQYPPLPCSHDEIAERGAGRYSVWSDACWYSSFDNAPPRGRYRLVRRTVGNEPFTEYLARVIDAGAGGRTGLLALIEAQVQRARDVRPPALAVGDRVAVVTHSLPPGGAERQWCYLAIGLRDAGFDVQVVCTEALEGSNAHYLPLLQEAGIPVLECPRVDDATAVGIAFEIEHGIALLQPESDPVGTDILRLAALLKQFRPRAVFSQLDSPNIAAGVAAHIADVPAIVLSFRNYNPSHFTYLRNDWYLPCYQRLAASNRIRLCGNSTLANEDYADWIGVERRRIQLVPNCIEEADVAGSGSTSVERLRRELGVTANTPVVLGVFRLSEEKDPLAFVDVFDRLLAWSPEARGLLVGEGPMRADVLRELERRNLGNRLLLLGRRHDVPDLMRLASVVLLTSRYEGMPNVAMEASMLGVPVVGTAIGGTPDVVLEGRTGFVRAVGDAQGLAEACASILSDPALAVRLAQAARVRARSHFSRSEMARRCVDLVSAAKATATESATA